MTKATKAMAGMKFGCDPELFVFNRATGRYVTAAGLIPGDKDNPFAVKGGAVQVDGMAAEFNIDPVETFDDFNYNIDRVLKQLGGMLPKDHELHAVPSVVFDLDNWQSAPDDAKILGCTPDFNAWTGEVNPPPMDPENPSLRTASGHLHIGWTEGASMSDDQHIGNCRDLVKQLDWFLGGWSINQDSDPTRRKLYGRAGACRFKPYGVEYRVLSNFWVMEKAKRLAVWNRMQAAINAMATCYVPDKVDTRGYNSHIVDIINKTEDTIGLSSVCHYPLSTLDASYARF